MLTMLDYFPFSFVFFTYPPVMLTGIFLKDLVDLREILFKLFKYPLSQNCVRVSNFLDVSSDNAFVATPL